MSENPRLLIGAPILNRDWIIDRYLAHALEAINQVEEEIDFAFLFVGGEQDPTFSVVKETLEGKAASYVSYFEEDRQGDERRWTHARYHRMVDIRNHLLEQVRTINPDWFLSLDSDILVHPQLINNLLETSRKYDIVGGRAYMSPRGTRAPSNAFLRGGNSFLREDTHHVLPVDVVMAIKLMNRAAYHVDYEFDRRGEDIGICMAWKRAGLKIAYDGRVANKHCMTKAMFEKVDDRVGF